MARVLPFARPATAEQPSPSVERWATAPRVSPFGGSLDGATEAEVQAAAVAYNPMRLLVRQRCDGCGHEWQAPAKGACPSCHGVLVSVIDSIPCMAQRV